MLFLVGLGLSEKDITAGALDVCRNCELYVDTFTSLVPEGVTDSIMGITGRRITVLSRQDMEENAADLVRMASGKDIAILVGGDPLIATTHKILYIEAKKQGVKTIAIHANSIITTAIGESGLDFYRFGSTCTVPRWSEHYSPMSFYEKIESNLKNNEHTILLLDYDAEKKSTISIKDVVSILEKAEAHYKKGVINPATRIIILHNMLREDAKVIMTTIKEAEEINHGGVNVLVLPAELKDIEKEAVHARLTE